MKNQNQNNLKEESVKTSKGKSGEKQKEPGFFDRVKHRLYMTKLTIGFVVMILYTLFTLVMLYKNWGNSTYLYIIMGFVAFYILLFTLILLLAKSNAKRFDRSMKDYKSGLKILTAILQIVSIVLSISIFAHSFTAKDILGTPFQILVLVLSLAWAVIQIVYHITKIIKRHKSKQKKNIQQKDKTTAKKDIDKQDKN